MQVLPPTPPTPLESPGPSVLSQGPRHSGSRSSILPSPSLSMQSPQWVTCPAHDVTWQTHVYPPSSVITTPASDTTMTPPPSLAPPPSDPPPPPSVPPPPPSATGPPSPPAGGPAGF